MDVGGDVVRGLGGEEGEERGDCGGGFGCLRGGGRLSGLREGRLGGCDVRGSGLRKFGLSRREV